MHFAIHSYILLALTLLYVSISFTILHKERSTVTDISAVLHFQTNHDHNRGLFYIIAEPVLGLTKHFPKWQTSDMELKQIFQDFVN